MAENDRATAPEVVDFDREIESKSPANNSLPIKSQDLLPVNSAASLEPHCREGLMTEVQCSIITNIDGLLTKKVTPDGIGGINKVPGANMTKGYSKSIALPFTDFGALLRSLEPNQALAYGVTGREGKVSLTTAGNLEQKRKRYPETIARTQEFFHYPIGPGIGMFDHDPKPNQAELSPDEFLAIIHKVLPDFKKFPTWTTPSTSSYIYDMDGQLLTQGSNGWHMYFPFYPANKLPEFSRWLFKKLWLEGYGSIFVTKAGALLERTIFDAAVFSPERLDFVAGAKCYNCVQKMPDPEYRAVLEVAAI